MPWVRFVRDFDFRHNPRALTAYKAGQEYLVKAACADAAVAAGAGQLVPRPKPKGASHDDGE